MSVTRLATRSTTASALLRSSVTHAVREFDDTVIDFRLEILRHARMWAIDPNAFADQLLPPAR